MSPHTYKPAESSSEFLAAIRNDTHRVTSKRLARLPQSAGILEAQLAPEDEQQPQTKRRPRFLWSVILALSVASVVAARGSTSTAEEYEWVGNYIDQAHLIPSTNFWSAFEGAYWLGLKVPGLEYSFDPDDNSDDDALFGTGYDPGPPYVKLPPWHLQRGGTLFFGDFVHRLNSSISPYAYYQAHDLVNRQLRMQSGNWTFDFGPHTNSVRLLDSGRVGKSGSYTLTDRIVVGEVVKHVGAAGNASLTVKNGTLSAPYAVLGATEQSRGKLVVTGDKAKLHIENLDGYGDFHIGDAGAGELRVERGAQLDVGGETVLGLRRGSTGSGYLTGRDTQANLNRGVVVGAEGTGRLTVSDGATLSTKDVWNFIGAGDHSRGEVIVTGRGSEWIDMFRLTVGGVYHTDTSGKGRLTIANGGFLSSQEASIGNRSQSTGNVTVSGQDAHWHTDLIMLGDDGRGALMVTNQGRVSTGSHALIGNTFNGIGQALVQSGGKWDAEFDVSVGVEGQGSLFVGFDGEMRVGRSLRVGPRGKVKLRPGGWINIGAGPQSGDEVLRVGPGGMLSGSGLIDADILVDGGVVSPGQSPGILTITGNYQQLAGSTLVMEIAGTTPGFAYDQLVASGNMFLDGDVAVDFIDGFVPRSGDRFDLVKSPSIDWKGKLQVLNAPADFRYMTNLADGRFSLTVVPEPTTLMLMMTCFYMIGIYYRRRRIEASGNCAFFNGACKLSPKYK